MFSREFNDTAVYGLGLRGLPFFPSRSLHTRAWSLGFRVWSLEFGVWGLGFRVEGMGVEALRCEI